MRHCWLSAEVKSSYTHRESLSAYSRCHRNHLKPSPPAPCPGITQQIWTLSPPQFVFIADLECPVCPQAHPVCWERGWETAHTRDKKKERIKYWLTGALLSIVWEDGDGRSSQSSGTHTGSHGRIGFYQTLTWWSHGQLFARKFLQVLTETSNPVAHPAPFPPSPNTPLLRLESGIREGGLWLWNIHTVWHFLEWGGIVPIAWRPEFKTVCGCWASYCRCVWKQTPCHGTEGELNTSEHSRR